MKDAKHRVDFVRHAGHGSHNAMHLAAISNKGEASLIDHPPSTDETADIMQPIAPHNTSGREPTLHLLTFMDDLGKPFLFLQISAEMHQLNPQILGLAGNLATWPDGLGRKINALRSFVEQDQIFDDDIVVFVDAYDVIVFGAGNEIVNRFLKLQRHTSKSIIFAAERDCYPQFPEICNEQYPPAKFQWRYLNSGLLAGRVGALREMLRRPAPDQIPGGDQTWYQRYFLAHSDMVALDTEHYLFGVVPGPDEESFSRSGRRFKNMVTGTEPSFIHFVSMAHWARRNPSTGLPNTYIQRVFADLYPTQFERHLDSMGLTLGYKSFYNRKLEVQDLKARHLIDAIIGTKECVTCFLSFSQDFCVVELPLLGPPCTTFYKSLALFAIPWILTLLLCCMCIPTCCQRRERKLASHDDRYQIKERSPLRKS